MVFMIRTHCVMVSQIEANCAGKVSFAADARNNDEALSKTKSQETDSASGTATIIKNF